MTSVARIEDAWKRIEAWLGANLPAALDNLREPATDEQLAELEATIDRPLPLGIRTLLALHDGEQEGWGPSAFADGHWFLPSDQLSELWEQQASIAEEMGGVEDVLDFWRAQVEDGIIFVQGPVKPKFGSRAWIPFSTLDGHVQRFVDLEPAPGGAEGQVIEIDPEGCTYRVLAQSLSDFLAEYADSLERGDFLVDAEGIRSEEEGVPSPVEWGLPAYLAATPFKSASPDLGSPSGERLKVGEEVILEGRMGVLLGGPETIFSLETADGREHTFLAKADVTKGYSAIAIRQSARVRARPYAADTRSFFVDQAGSAPPDFVALEYTMLR